MTGSEVLASLDPPWRVAFDEAWQSFQSGNFGIGAALADPDDGTIVSSGRNRVAQASPQLRQLSGNMTAHAEMNAFASLARFNADGLDLYTTLEPCLMCAATAMQLKVRHVHFAVHDEFYDGLDDSWDMHPVTKGRRPTRTGPFDGATRRLAHFARLLPLTFTVEHFSGRSAEKLARQHHPELAATADELRSDGALARFRRQATAGEALDLLWDRLPT